MVNNKQIGYLIEHLGPERVKKDEVLASYTTFKIGGPARLFYVAKNTNELIKATLTARRAGIPYKIIGGGTNLVVNSQGFPGLVIKNESNKINLLFVSGKISKGNSRIDQVVVEVDSGVMINHLVRYTVLEGLAGLQHFLGQPGTIGGAMYINAHNMNKGVFFADYVLQATILDGEDRVMTVDRDYFHFGYDESVIQKSDIVVLKVKLGLKRGDKEKLWQEAKTAMEYRRNTQPLGIPSSGCTFRNFSKADAVRLNTPSQTTSAGYLLDQLGFKGYRIGGAMFSQRHANFILNVDNATSSDVLSLINLAKKKVKKAFAVDLKEEVVIF